MLIRFLVGGAVITGMTIGAANIWLAKSSDSDEKVVRTATYRAIRYGVLWPKTWLNTYETYQRGGDWMEIFRP